MEDATTDKVATAPVITINARGKLIGDVSHVPAEVIEKLSTPEGQAQLKQTYRKEFGTDRRTMRSKQIEKVVGEDRFKTEQRDFRHLCPPGMSQKEFRKLRRNYMRKQTKAVLKEMRHAGN